MLYQHSNAASVVEARLMSGGKYEPIHYVSQAPRQNWSTYDRIAYPHIDDA